MKAPGGRRKLILVAILLACFLGVDRFLVQAGAGAYSRALGAFRGAEDEFLQARSAVERLARMKATLGENPVEGRGIQGSGAIAFLNGLLSRRNLQKVDLRAESKIRATRGEPYQLTVQGSYGNLVLFLRDLESSQGLIWLRDVRISRPYEATGLEMLVRLEIEGPKR